MLRQRSVALKSFGVFGDTVFDFVAQICALCGVTSSNINPAVFANTIKNTFTQDSQSGFNAGSYSDTLWNTAFSGVTLSVVYYGIGGEYTVLTGTYDSPMIDGGASLTGIIFQHFIILSLLVPLATAIYQLRFRNTN